MNPIAAILLAAGSASRMGANKQLFQFDGQSLVRRAASAAIDADCSPVIVVTGAAADPISKEISDLPLEIAFNPEWSTGIGSSIRQGLSAALAKTPSIAAALFILCDQPHLNAKILRDLIHAFSTSAKPMAACQYSNTHGPPCCFARSMFEELSRLPSPDGAKKLLLAAPEKVTPIKWPQGAEDVDTPEDWNRFTQKTNTI